MIHEIKGIKLMRWHRLNGDVYIYAKAHNFLGDLKLRLCGYKPKFTAFGVVLKKEFKTNFTNRSK